MGASQAREEVYETIRGLLGRFHESGMAEQLDFDRFHLYSIITHSTAIEGSTLTEIETRLLFDEGITASGRSLTEQLMNLDLRAAYLRAREEAERGESATVPSLCELAALVMRNTGARYSTLEGTFDSSKGELRLLNVSAGAGGRSYMHHSKVPSRLEAFCEWLNAARKTHDRGDTIAAYRLSFEAHYQLVIIHPWADGNGRMSRLIMNRLQWEFGLVPSLVRRERKAQYIASLAASREEESPEPFYEFMFEELRDFLARSIAEYEASI